MATRISENTMEAIEPYLDLNIRELDAVSEMLYHEFGIDLSDLYNELELEDALREGDGIMIGYIVVGVTCFLIGNFAGVLALSLCIAAKERDDYQNCTKKGESLK